MAVPLGEPKLEASIMGTSSRGAPIAGKPIGNLKVGSHIIGCRSGGLFLHWTPQGYKEHLVYIPTVNLMAAITRKSLVDAGRLRCGDPNCTAEREATLISRKKVPLLSAK